MNAVLSSSAEQQCHPVARSKTAQQPPFLTEKDAFRGRLRVLSEQRGCATDADAAIAHVVVCLHFGELCHEHVRIGDVVVRLL